ncbi:MAG: CDGSH iron-sulfur domain-containing protein [Bacteroidales bacterium]|jgi:CDGSH-type Zn-finger protein
MVSKIKPTKSYSKSSIQISKNGPYLVSNLPLDEAIMVCTDDGSPIDWKKGKNIKTRKDYALCRCGHSKNKPFCTGEHNKIGFNGEETASKEKFLKNSEVTVGKKLALLDNGSFCNHSGFCTVGIGVWEGVMVANDKNSKEKVVKQICNCPTGRLVALDISTKKELEPKFKKSISLIEEPEGHGAIWVKGKVEIKSCDGKKLEKRNRVCLCRCGKSQNKPFCDGSHLD